MRLSDTQASAISHLTQSMFGADSQVWLFGSRVDNAKRGGDIDLYVEVQHPVTMAQRLSLMSKLQMAIGLRKIDLLVNDHSGEAKTIFVTAKAEGIRL